MLMSPPFQSTLFPPQHPPQKPTLIPLHSRPVQADDQALLQASTVRAAGSARMLPRRISSMGLREVTTMIHSGSRKNRAAETRKT